MPGVRHVLVAEQRRAGEHGGVVMEGRDIGSVVFPDAQLKIFLTASPETRAERRWREHQQKGDAIDLPKTLEEIHERDRRDKRTQNSPLVRAADAVVVDSTAMEPEEVARLVVMLAERERRARQASSDAEPENLRFSHRFKFEPVSAYDKRTFGPVDRVKIERGERVLVDGQRLGAAVDLLPAASFVLQRETKNLPQRSGRRAARRGFLRAA